MIITMKNTETREISAKIDELHEERGEAALGRVLTLLISTNEASLEHDLEVANSASREHPCRVIAIAPNSRKMDADTDDGQPHTFLDAEVRFGSDAGAGEIIVLRPLGGLVYHADTLVIPLLVPDTSSRHSSCGNATPSSFSYFLIIMFSVLFILFHSFPYCKAFYHILF